MTIETDIRIGDVMTIGVITLAESKTAMDAAKLLKKTDVGSIIVTKKGKAEGIVTERDLVHKVMVEGKDPKKVTLKQVMSTPLRVIEAKDTIQKAAMALKSNKIKRLPVINKDKKLVGIITQGDLVKTYPGLIDVILEGAELEHYREDMYLAGQCGSCGAYSDDLRRVERRLLCPECRAQEGL